MTRRTLFAVIAYLLLAAACGREGGTEGELAVEGRTPGPTATATAPGASPRATTTAPAATTAPGAAAAPGGAAPTQTTKPAAEGGVNTPKDGRYVYEYKGQSSNPFNPGAPPQDFDGELTSEYTHSGNVYTRETTNSEQPGRQTTRSRWEPAQILLLSIKIETAGGDFNCTYDPPLVIAKIPIKPEKFPTQHFEGEGNACNGKLDITVERQENVTDATGRSWPTWRVLVDLEVGNEQFTNRSRQTQWFSPDLGIEVRTDGTSETEVRSPPGKFTGNATTVLKSHP